MGQEFETGPWLAKKKMRMKEIKWSRGGSELAPKTGIWSPGMVCAHVELGRANMSGGRCLGFPTLSR